MSTGGFIDLRVHRATESSHSDDSIWPSFTDIMMVVVMIFLMSSVIFMLRNVQLDEDIERATVAESMAVQETESLRERTAYLAEIIAQTKKQLSLTELQRQELKTLSEVRGVRISELEVETAQLFQTQQQLNVEVTGLNQRLEQIRGERNSLTERISSMNTTIEQLNELIDTKSAEYDTLHANFQQKQNTLRLVEERLDSRNRDLENLSASLAQLEDLEASQRGQIATLEQIKAERELQIQNLVAESGLKDEQIARLTETRRHLSASLTARLGELEVLQQTYRESLASIESLQAQLQERSAQLQDQTLASAQLQGVVEQLESVKTEQGETIEFQVETQAQLREELSRRVAQVSELERQLLAKSDQFTQLTAREASLMADFETLSASHFENTQVIENQERQIQTLRDQIAQQLANLDDAQRAIESQATQLTEVREQQVATLNELEQERRLNEQLKQQQSDQIASMTEQLSVNEQTAEQQTQQIESLKVRYAERLAELNRVEADFKERKLEVTRLQEQLTSMIEQLDSLQTALSVRDTQISTLNVQIGALDDEVDWLSASEKELKEQIIQLLNEKSEHQDEIAQQRQELQGLEDEIRRVTIENDDFRRELEYSRQLQADRQQQLVTLQTVMQQLSQDLKARDERLESLRSENDRLLKTEIRGDRQITQLRQAYQERLKELNNLQQALASRSGEVEQLQSELVEFEHERELMLRPARSPANRFVVEVFFSKSDSGDAIYQYRLPGQSATNRVSRDELENLLERLKNERSEGLYTKIIFPDEDRLSFSEAWDFTQHIHSNYDYYSR